MANPMTSASKSPSATEVVTPIELKPPSFVLARTHRIREHEFASFFLHLNFNRLIEIHRGSTITAHSGQIHSDLLMVNRFLLPTGLSVQVEWFAGKAWLIELDACLALVADSWFTRLFVFVRLRTTLGNIIPLFSSTLESDFFVARHHQRPRSLLMRPRHLSSLVLSSRPLRHDMIIFELHIAKWVSVG